jgi:hypothetical protein
MILGLQQCLTGSLAGMTDNFMERGLQSAKRAAKLRIWHDKQFDDSA